MKPCATSARLFSSARVAMSSCDLVDEAVCSACFSFSSSSVVSSWPSTWPARTRSPSRTVSDFTSAATRARTTALLTAFRPPEISSVRGRSTVAPRGRRRAPGRGRPAPWPTRSASPCRPASRPAPGRRSRRRRRRRRRRSSSVASASSPSAVALARRLRLRRFRRAPVRGAPARVCRPCSTRSTWASITAFGSSLAPATQAPSECLFITRKSSGAISAWTAFSTLTGRNSPLSMPRWTISAIIAVGRRGDLVDPELGDLREVAHLGHHQLEDARGAGLADPLPPEAEHVGEQLGGAALEGADDLHALGDLVHHVVADHFLEQLFLARVVQVERALG